MKYTNGILSVIAGLLVIIAVILIDVSALAKVNAQGQIIASNVTVVPAYEEVEGFASPVNATCVRMSSNPGAYSALPVIIRIIR